ncbi:MAG: SUMF1/EgtB/PvdO family nonheme iron enzyme [Alphaproteobacteria bacterium]
MVDIFISYARRERAKVEPLKARFEAMGLDIFFDIEGIDGGAVFPDVITRALDTSKAVLACWTPFYFTRPWCLIEAREAKDRDILVPVAIEPFARTDQPADLRHVNYYDLFGWQGEDSFENWTLTLKRLGRLVGRELAPTLKTGPFGGIQVVEPAPEPPPAAGPRIDVLADLRQTWRDFPARDNADLVSRFLQRVQSAAPGSGLEFEIEHHLTELQRAAEPVDPPPSTVWTPGRVFRDGDGLPELVVVPAGRFVMGAPPGEEGRSDDEGPQHEVRFAAPFALGRYPVTFGEYDAFCEAEGRRKPKDQGWGRGGRPVIDVSWDDAKAYCAWASDRTGAAYRLPSEAEWEYACRAGTTTPFSFGETIFTDQANYDGNHRYGNGRTGEYRKRTTPVGTFPANAFGLHDMHGNVFEWCEDPWHDSYVGAPADGSAWVANPTDSTARVVRGGSWFSQPLRLRSAFRLRGRPDYRFDTRGLRVARTL